MSLFIFQQNTLLSGFSETNQFDTALEGFLHTVRISHSDPVLILYFFHFVLFQSVPWLAVIPGDSDLTM